MQLKDLLTERNISAVVSDIGSGMEQSSNDFDAIGSRFDTFGSCSDNESFNRDSFVFRDSAVD